MANASNQFFDSKSVRERRSIRRSIAAASSSMLGWLRPRAVSCKPSKRQLTAESDDRHQTVVHAQHWQGNLPVETILPPLPDVDELNAKTDKTKWETGLDGKPRAP